MTPAALRCLRAELAAAIHQTLHTVRLDVSSVSLEWQAASAVLAVLERQGIINNEGDKQ